MGQQLMAIVLQGDRERVYVPPLPDHEGIAASAEPHDVPESDMPERALGFRVRAYGMTRHSDLFTPRQLVALTAFSELVGEARRRAEADAVAAGLPDDGVPLEQGGAGARAYGEAVATYLSFALSKMADRGSSICTWSVNRDSTRNTFARQAIPMTWDFAELNTLLGGTGSFVGAVNWTAESVEALGQPCSAPATALQGDATARSHKRLQTITSTDPPYYDNIGYADLSDFFYVWLRRSLKEVYPSLFGTVLTPKAPELIATPYRDHGGTDPREFFEEGLRRAFAAMRAGQAEGFPLTVFYAFKQAESDGDGGQASTGWETMLEGLLGAGLSVEATWPVRTEWATRNVSRGTNALASSIVLVCRPRREGAPLATRNELVGVLRRELPAAVKRLQAANIAPVDLAQSAIGPGMAVFSRYAKVLEPDGSTMGVRAALALVNQVLRETLEGAESELDRDTAWAVTWFEQRGFEPGPYGEAETLCTARNTSVAGLVEAGILHSRGGTVRLLPREELEEGWDPATDDRFTVWEACQHLIRTLERGGERAGADLLRRLGSTAGPARELAYRLYEICERRGWAEEARAYNGLIAAWQRMTALAAGFPEQPENRRLGFEG